MEHAVDAVPHAHLKLAGLNMDVGRQVLNGLSNDEVDEAHDRRVVGVGFSQRDFVALSGGRLFLDRRREVTQLTVGTVQAVDRRNQVVLLGHDGDHVHAGEGTNVVHCEHVTGLDHRERDRRGCGMNGQDAVPSAELRRNKRDRRAIDRVLGQLDERQPGDLSLRRRDLGGTHESALHKIADDDLVAFLAQLVESLDRKQPADDEHFAYRNHSSSLPPGRTRPGNGSLARTA